MHEHDQELIMALAEGTLGDAATAAAQTEIAMCADCSADLELQIAALAVLDDVPDVYLSAAESARLHSSLKQELSLETAKSPSPRRSFAWSRLLPAAGVAAALLVVIVSLPSLLGGGDSDDASTETIAAPSLDAGATETTAAAFLQEARDGAEEMAGADNSAAEAAPPAGNATTEAPAATTTTTAPSDTTASDLTTVLDGLEYLGLVAELDTVALGARIATDGGPLALTSDRAKALDPTFAACAREKATPEVADDLGVPVDSDPLLLGIVADENGEELVLVAYVPADGSDPVFATFRAFGCELVEFIP